MKLKFSVPFFPSVSQQQQPGVLPGGGGSRGAPFPDMFGADKATSSSSFGDLGLRGTLGGALSQFPPSVARPPPTSLSGFPPASLPPPQQASPNSRTMLTIGSRALPGQRQVGPDINRLVGLGAPPRTGYTDQSSLWRNNVPASGGGISSFGMSHSSRNFPSSQSLMGNSLQSQLFNSNPALDLSEFPSLTNRGSQEGSAQSLSSNPMAGRAAYGKLSGSAQDSCDVDVDGAEELMPVALRDTLRGKRFADYVEVDTGASVCGALTDEDIIAQVAGAQPVAEEPEGEEDEDDEAPVRPSASAVMEALNVARLFFSFGEGEEDSLRRVRALEQRAAAVAFREKKQMVITDFFGQ
ncbi:hypothetical protein HPB52_007380 [Rhipicephalus sanguineus]|uniref:Uncharacterized protein n=1 Tax=Rhipicephalus sanguineus TaxID=34632 RepID=A0A9D4SQF5_RHISA|nr:hypothetical protein HPB52_007380 [Rhipicephalus sanguineus]